MIKNKIKSATYKIIKSFIIKRADRIESHIPKVEIEEFVISNTKLLVDRFELLKRLPKNSIGAELGVDEGNFTKSILDIVEPKKLYLVDVWASARYNVNKKKYVNLRFMKEFKSGQIQERIGYSTEISDSFSDSLFDWIYIDTAHTYQITYSELKKYAPKVKDDGIILGHDFVRRNRRGTVRYGVIEAVYKFCMEENWKIVYITCENQGNPSFGIKRI